MSQKYSHLKTLKKAITVIASEFFTFFADQVKEKTGIRPTPDSISVQSVEIQRNLGRKRELYLVDLYLNTDSGVHETKLFLKLFKDHEKVLTEASGAMQLEELLKIGKSTQNVMTPKLLYYSKEWNILVYEGIYAEEFENFNLFPLEDKLLLVGFSLPKIHGITIKEVDLQRYYLLLETTMKQLNQIVEYSFPPETQGELQEVQNLLINDLEQRMFYSYSGALSFGDFHSGNIMFEAKPFRIRKSFNEDHSSNYAMINRVVVWVLDPEFFDAESSNYDRIDRMEDIANIFTGILISEFIEKNKISNSAKLIEKFVLGYDLEFKESTSISLLDCYPKGTTLEYQLSQSILFDLISYLRSQFDVELMLAGFNTRIKLIKLLLKNRIIIGTK